MSRNSASGYNFFYHFQDSIIPLHKTDDGHVIVTDTDDVYRVPEK